MNTENRYQETDLGNVSPNPRGEYTPGTEYEYLDLVTFDGGSYICIAELGTTTSISPESGKNTDFWQCMTIPGDMTPEYVAMHDRVVNLSEQVEADAEEVRVAEQNVSGMKENVTQMQEQTRQSAESAEQSKDSAAGYAASADASRQAAETSEQNINAQVTGFDAHVAEKTSEAEQSVEASRIAANKAVLAQQEQSVNEVARVGGTAVSEAQTAARVATEKASAASESEKNAKTSETAAKLSETNATKMAEQVAADKEQVANDRAAVENAKQEMTGSVAQIEQNTQEIIELKGDLVELTSYDLYQEPIILFQTYINFLSGAYEFASTYWNSTRRLLAKPLSCVKIKGNHKDKNGDDYVYKIAEYDENGAFISKSEINNYEYKLGKRTHSIAFSYGFTDHVVTDDSINDFDYSINSYNNFNKYERRNDLEWVQGAMGAYGEIVEGDYSTLATSLYAPIGTRLLINIPHGYFVQIYFNGLRRRVYDMPKFEFVTNTTQTNIIFGKSGEKVTDKNLISVYNIFRYSNDYDVIVASSDSSIEEKRIADYVCDGINDEVEINCAINSNISCGNKVNVLLLSGNYHIDSFSEYNSYEVVDEPTKYTDGFGAIITRESWLNDNRYDCEIYGKYHANNGISGNTKLLVSSNVINNMDTNKEYHVLTAMRKGDSEYGYMYGLIKNNYKNIYVQIDGHDKNVIAFDGTANNAFTVEYCRVRTDINDNQNFDNIFIADKLIGIRGDTGQDSGASQYIKHTIVSGLGVGLDLTGEHFIVEQLSSLINKIGVKTHGTKVFGFSSHTSVFKNITIERCDRVLYLDEASHTDEALYSPNGSSIWIDGCATETHWVVDGVDCYMKPIFEKLKFSYVGEINMEWPIDSLMYDTTSSVGASCGQVKLKKSNFPRMLYGAIGYRTLPDATKQQAATEIYDPQNKCILLATSQGWVKPDGTFVDK